MSDLINEFFSLARERYSIFLKKKNGGSPPWTEDPIFQRYRFTNVFREDDTTTQWFREHVRDPLRDKPEMLLATVVFRLFNRITTGEAIFLQPALGLGDELEGESAWDAFLRTGDVGNLRAAILTACGRGPYVTGSYIIKTPDGLDKLDGVLQIVKWFVEREYDRPHNRDQYRIGEIKHNWKGMAEFMLAERNWSLQSAHHLLTKYPFIGHFTAYEIVSDLRHTALLDQAPDIMTWANAGPGAQRGLSRVCGRKLSAKECVKAMQDLLVLSQMPNYWPSDWPAWDMRTVEHWSCEVDKYMRVREGGPPPRQRYKG